MVSPGLRWWALRRPHTNTRKQSSIFPQNIIYHTSLDKTRADNKTTIATSLIATKMHMMDELLPPPAIAAASSSSSATAAAIAAAGGNNVERQHVVSGYMAWCVSLCVKALLCVCIFLRLLNVEFVFCPWPWDSRRKKYKKKLYTITSATTATTTTGNNRTKK